MTPFEHLSVLISLVIGLGLTHLLSGAHRLVQAHGRIRLHWLPLVWAVLIFTAQVEWWWSIFGWRNEGGWNFFYFLFILLSPVAMYLASTFVLPEIEPNQAYDLRVYYFETRRWLFTFVALSPAVDAVRRGFQSGTIADFGVWSNAVAALLVGSLAISRRLWYHALVTFLVAALFLAFIVSSALELV